MKKIILSLSCLLSVPFLFAQNCEKIFISEYVEGYGNNKALEIYNPTGAPVNLGEYFLQRYNNGSTTASAQGTFQARTIQLPTYTLESHQTYVIVLDRNANNSTPSDPAVWTELYDIANAHLCSSYDDNNVMNFNGNDALLLAKGDATNPMTAQTVVYDVFGKIGEDPDGVSGGAFGGWTSVSPYNGTSGNVSDKVITENHSMIRKSGVKVGFVPNPLVGATFNPLLEWDSIPASLPKIDPITGDTVYQADGVTPQWEGNWSSLGWHACECDPNSLSLNSMNLAEVMLYPNPSTGVFSISGLKNVSTIEVYNSLGQEITTIKNNTQTSVSFDLREKTGVYMITIRDLNGRSATQKVIIK